MGPAFVHIASSKVGATVVTLAAAWLSWYIWKFVVTPRLYPNEPRELPYLIPVLGHMPRFFRDSHGLYSYAREYFGNTREPFSITTMGQSTYIVTSAADVSAIYKLPKALDINPFIYDIMLSFGLPQSEVDKMFDRSMYPGDKSWMDVSHDNFKLQMHPGEKMNIVQDKLLGRIDELMQDQHLQGRMVVPGPLVASAKDSKVVSLYVWAQEFIVDATTRAFFDDLLFELAPDYLSQFWIFEDEAWKLPLKLPDFAAKKLYSSKKYLEDALTRYMNSPLDQRESESWLVTECEHGLQLMGVDNNQKGPTMFTFYRTAATNAYKFAFWLLSYILFDPPTMARVKQEIDGAFDADGKTDFAYLLDSCPLLNAMYEETLRTVNCPLGVRTVTQDTVVGGKLLRANKQLFMAYRQLHYNPDVFGHDVNTFRATRFLDNPKLVKSTSFRPFGGAVSYCPGRFLARREVLLFVATALKRFDLEVVGRGGKVPRFPKPDDGLPSGGVYAPLAGEEVLLRVKVITFDTFHC